MERNINGTIKRGAVLNPAGRPKGSKNKTTSDVKEFLTSFIGKELENIQSYIDKLEPKDKLDFIVKLLPYVVSKEKESIEISDTPKDTPVIIQFVKQKEESEAV